jgi:O-antigen ligase
VDPLRTTAFARRWAPRMMILSLFSYPAIALMTSIFDMDSRIAAVPLRIVVFVVSLYVIAGTYQDGRWLRKNYWVMAFALLYLARLLYDWLIADVPKVTEALTFYLVACLVPCIASGMAGIIALGEKRAAWQLALAGGAICGLAVLMSLLGLGAARTYDPWSTGGRLSFEALNPITLGHIGASTLIALLSLTRTRMPMANFVVLIALAAIAVWTMLAAGSRGPIISLACAGLVYAAMTARFGWILVIIGAVVAMVLFGENSLLTRFEGATSDESALIRLAIQGNAVIQFLGSPILGSAYTELESLEYPHNLFIETAMAMGLVGLLLLFIVLFRSARIAWRSLKEGRTLIPLLFVQSFIGLQFSGSIWGATGLYLTVMVLGSYPKLRRSASADETPGPSRPSTAPSTSG